MAIKLIVGLGNVGPRYTETRHNVGFLVVDELAHRAGVSFKTSGGFFKKPLAAEAKLGELTLIKPSTMMNASGKAVQAYQAKLRLKPEEILLIHDDLDLPLGRLRFKANGGGAGGQNGVKDTIARIGPNFVRLKLGIGRPPEGWKVYNWVLSKFSEDERALLDRVVTAAADAAQTLVDEGVTAAVNGFNGANLATLKKPERLPASKPPKA